MQARKPLPVYGDGKNIRDWLYVEDHNSAVWTIMKQGKAGEKYNIGGETEWENIRLVEELCRIYAELTGAPLSEITSLITYVKDRPGHDRRYAINCSKLKDELGWQKAHDFQTGLQKTVQWYIKNKSWVSSVATGQYKNWITENYANR
jgi:dTDP-glucose 4,6-dehydratase